MRTYNDGEEALARADGAKPLSDLVVLDIKMPRMDGMELLSRLSARSRQVPAIFLTSKDDEQDEVHGLRMGADDYITKPFSQRLLIERVRALLRREQHRARRRPRPKPAMNQPCHGTRGEHGAWTSDKHLCTWKGKTVDLTVTEFLLVKTLAVSAPGTSRRATS